MDYSRISNKPINRSLTDYSNKRATESHANAKQPNVSLDDDRFTTIHDTKQQIGMTAADWNRRWEDKAKVRRWELIDVHPFLKQYLPSPITHPRVLVSLAGKSVDLFWLLDKGFQVSYVDTHKGINMT